MARSADKQFTLKDWKLDVRVRDEIRDTGLLFFHDLAKHNAGFLKDNRFFDAMKSFYDGKEYCFNLGGDKRMFFGADSILVLTGLKFSGKVVRVKDSYPLGEVVDGKRLVDGLGWVDTEFLDGKCIKLAGLKEFMKVENQSLDHCVNAFVLFILGTSILATSSRKVPLRYLYCIKDGRFKEHAWGLVLLSHMHYYLGAKKQDQVTSSACAYLYMLFFFEHLPGLRDAFFKDENGDLIFSETNPLPANFPLGLSWAPYVRRILQKKRYPVEIDYISLIKESEITWKAYERLGENFLPVHIRGDFEMRFYRGPLIHPIHNSGKGYQHRPDNCPRHFGVNFVEFNHCPKIVLPYEPEDLREAQWHNWRNCLIRLPDHATSSSQTLDGNVSKSPPRPLTASSSQTRTRGASKSIPRRRTGVGKHKSTRRRLLSLAATIDDLKSCYNIEEIKAAVDATESEYNEADLLRKGMLNNRKGYDTGSDEGSDFRGSEFTSHNRLDSRNETGRAKVVSEKREPQCNVYVRRAKRAASEIMGAKVVSEKREPQCNVYVRRAKRAKIQPVALQFGGDSGIYNNSTVEGERTEERLPSPHPSPAQPVPPPANEGQSDGEQEELPPPPANRMKRPANEGDSGILRPRTMIHGKQFYEDTPTSGHVQKLPRRKK